MSNRFKNADVAVDDKVETDFVAGASLLDTDIYPATIKAAYEVPSASSQAIMIHYILVINSKEYRFSNCIISGKGVPTYGTGKDKKNLPGFTQLNSLTMLALGTEVGDTEVEELTLKLYDYDAKAEVPKAVNCYSDLHGVEVLVAIQKQTVDKTKKDDSTGKYEPTGETRDENEIVKFFPASAAVTISEVAQKIKSLGGTLDEVLAEDQMGDAVAAMIPDDFEGEMFLGTYAEKWLDNNKGQVYNRAKGAGKAGSGKSFGKKASDSDGEDKPKKKLFG